ncbi:unnamed protein product [Aphanomyces euteiches]|uniref:Uncharacterized protein n=1 Tax=Aphanomyces euteiches TaxID=100861 RepID=A0A6G0X3V8_9STRA|nr:hypothetical protein Ae201684_008781 [Aphanomyces euteiches]KAH9085362.1 hypothetical protein Ae201684P_005071 [Aphanomyces euteiches]
MHLLWAALWTTLWVASVLASNWAQISGVKATNAAIEQTTPWTGRWGHGAISQLYSATDQAKGKLSRMYVIGGDDRMQLATMKGSDFRAYPGGGSFRNDVWATTGVVWNTSLNLLELNQWGDPDPQIVAQKKWTQTNAGKVPPPGVLYTDWIACLTANWNPYPPTGCSDPTQPPGEYIADAMFSPRRHFAAVEFNMALYILGGRARELVPIPDEDTIGGLEHPRPARWMEYAVLKNDVWKSQDAGVSWSLVTPGCDVPNAHETYISGDAKAQCTSQNDCFGDTTCVIDPKTPLAGTCKCNMWSARELHTVVVFQRSFFLAGGYTAVQRNLCGPERNVRPSGEEFACGGLYRKYMNDVWTSSDGQRWTQLTASAAWSGRGEHAMAVWQNQMWLLGGRTGDTDESSQVLLNDIWRSSDGVQWSLIAKRAPWSPRGKHAVLGVKADPVLNASGYLILLYGENDDNFLGDVWIWSDTSQPLAWVQDFSDSTPVTKKYVTPTSPIELLQGMNASDVEELHDAHIFTIADLTDVSFDTVIDLRVNKGVPICDYIAIAKLVVDHCTIAPVDYDGKQFENVQVLQGKNAEAAASAKAAAASAKEAAHWDGCAHQGAPTLDWVTNKYVWPEVGGIPQVDTKDPFPHVQNTVCKWTPRPRSSFAAITHNNTVYVFGGKVDNLLFDNTAWYRDAVIPKAYMTSVPESYSHTTVFSFAGSKPGTIFQYHVLDMVEKLVVRNWTNCLHEVDFVEWLDGGLHRFRVRAVDAAGNVEFEFEDGRNQYVWVYVPRPPWNLIIAMLVLFFVICLGVFLEWRRRRKQAAMERHAMKRMRRKMRGKKTGGNNDVNWRETYDDAKDGKKSKDKSKKKSKGSKDSDKAKSSKKAKGGNSSSVAPVQDPPKGDKKKKDKEKKDKKDKADKKDMTDKKVKKDKSDDKKAKKETKKEKDPTKKVDKKDKKDKKVDKTDKKDKSDKKKKSEEKDKKKD